MNEVVTEICYCIQILRSECEYGANMSVPKLSLAKETRQK
jgi:hypothetical protein